jgi:hypothetical protein
MENKIIFAGLLMALLSVVGCDKGQLFDSTGSITTEVRETGAITKVAVYDNVNVIFTHRIDSGVMMVSAGEKIIRNISTEYADNTLTIKNRNKYKWTRDLNPDIRVYLPCIGIEEIRHESVGTISCDTALTGNTLKIDLFYGNGMIDLELFYNQIAVSSLSSGITDVVLKGQCNSLNLYHAHYAPFDCRKLQAQKVKVTAAGIQNCFVSASERLEPVITNYGNIYYYGNPEIVNYINTGEGKLIKKE